MSGCLLFEIAVGFLNEPGLLPDCSRAGWPAGVGTALMDFKSLETLYGKWGTEREKQI